MYVWSVAILAQALSCDSGCSPGGCGVQGRMAAVAPAAADSTAASGARGPSPGLHGAFVATGSVGVWSRTSWRRQQRRAALLHAWSAA